MAIQGQCHCGNLEHHLLLPASDKAVVACICRCSFCRLHHPVWLGRPASHYHLRAEQPEMVSVYRLGNTTADYLICRHCGVVMGALTMMDGHWWAQVNLQTLVLPSDFSYDEEFWSPKSEEKQERYMRRSRSWIAEVSFSSGLTSVISSRPGGYDGD